MAGHFIERRLQAAHFGIVRKAARAALFFRSVSFAPLVPSGRRCLGFFELALEDADLRAQLLDFWQAVGCVIGRAQGLDLPCG